VSQRPIPDPRIIKFILSRSLAHFRGFLAHFSKMSQGPIFYTTDVLLTGIKVCLLGCFTKVIDKSKKMSDVPQWFEGCRLNYAENLLRHRDDKVAIYGVRE